MKSPGLMPIFFCLIMIAGGYYANSTGRFNEFLIGAIAMIILLQTEILESLGQRKEH